MKRILMTAALLGLFATGYSQYFEGEIIYKNTFTSKMANVSGEQIGTMLGTSQEYFIKGGNYKSVMNGATITLQIYDNKTNRLYNRFPTSDTLFWVDAAINSDDVISIEAGKKEKVAGEDCDVLVMKAKSGTTTFYYSSKYKVNAALYAKHSYGNWYNFIKKSGALPLKMVMENGRFTMESTATEIKPMALGATYFDIKGTPVAQLRQ